MCWALLTRQRASPLSGRTSPRRLRTWRRFASALLLRSRWISVGHVEADCVPFGLLLKFLCQLVEARSRLYRRRFLQVNTRWKALDAIYKIRILLHRSDFKISVKNRQTFFENKKWNFQFSAFFDWILPFWSQILMKFYRNFAKFFRKWRNLSRISVFTCKENSLHVLHVTFTCNYM